MKNSMIQTKSTLINDFKKLGIKPKMTLIVHSSLSSIGNVSGGALSVIQALQEVLTEEGTLVMPTHSSHLSDPKEWDNPKINKNMWNKIRKEMPGYDKNTTPTYQMGIIPELFRTLPDVKRSNHPVYSFAAWGKEKNTLLENHSLNNGLGEYSPLARMYDLNGYILLLGTNYDSNTSMHLSEHRIGVFPQIKRKSPMIINDKKEWIVYSEIEYDEAAFIKIGESYEKNHLIQSGQVGEAQAKLINQKSIIDFTIQNLLSYA